jgi:hypothetical protein
MLTKLVKELTNRGITVVVENHLYDQARNDFLNRCRLLLNILRAPQDFVGQRFLLGAANKTLVISETVRDNRPVIPGEHFISVPWPQIPDKVQFYLSNENERKRIVDQAYQLIDQGELTIKRSVSLILQRARQARFLKMRSKER